jgi:carbon-monoxide dehydrogenase large subunit
MSATNGLIGKSVKRVEDKRFITGHGNYVDDIVLPKQTYAAFVRSPYAHAKILSVDIDAAKAMPGVSKYIPGRCCRCEWCALRLAGEF